MFQLARNSNSFATINMEEFKNPRPPPEESGSLVQPKGISTELYRYVRSRVTVPIGLVLTLVSPDTQLSAAHFALG